MKYIAPCTVVNSKSLGKNVIIHSFTQICENSTIGDNSKLGHNVFIGPGVSIGKNCNIQGNVYIPGPCLISDCVFIGPGVIFTNVKKPDISKKSEYEMISVGRYVVIGAGTIILPGIHIGHHSFIGAGSVVTKTVRESMLVYGNPAEEHGIFER
jgi:UDP-2-acetamido-3-amino-2,3-dideoxy-glucuronate N-acetyltransferase